MDPEIPVNKETPVPERPEPDASANESNPQRYQYKPLADNEIRLIRLQTQPRSNQSIEASDPILHVEIVHLSLTTLSPLVYEAVSYTWGSPIQSHTLSTISGSIMLVSRGLIQIFDALLTRSSGAESLLWIDQLCIDQENRAEKSRQILLMRQIYASAARVLVCLGDMWDVFALADARVLDAESVQSRRMLAAVIEKRVFSRVWVYQEIVSARELMILGNNIDGEEQFEVEWKGLVQKLENAVLFETVMRAEKIVSTSPGLERINMLVNDREQLERAGYLDWMLLLVQAQGKLECTDPRDKVVAMTTFQDFYRKTPDVYQMTTSTLYRITTHSLISTSHTLDIFGALSGRWHHPGFDDMPSWTPDFSRRTGVRPFYWPLQRTGFNAAANYSHKFIETQDKQRLRVMGREIDKICCYLEHNFEERESTVDVRSVLSVPWHHQVYLSQAESDESPIPQSDQHGVFLTLLAAMTAGFSSSTSFTEDTILGKLPKCFYEDMYDICAYHDMIIEGTYEPPGVRTFPTDALIPTLGKMCGSWQKALSKYSLWAGICSSRRILFGEKAPGKNRAIGLVPSGAKGEDSVWILHGSKVPVVLRRLGRCYRVIGQCYWDGWMYGEKIDWEENVGQSIDLV